jgi:uncharacterized protein (TIGR03083 family)
MGAMQRPLYIASVQADADRLVSVASGALDRPVPSCPGWNVERLVGHLGRTHRWVTSWVSRGSGTELEPAPAGDAVRDWCRSGTAGLVAALEAAPAGGEVQSWAGPQPAGFWHRRMAIETALHRWDGEEAVSPGSGAPVPAPLAVEAIDELFTVIVPWRGIGDLGTRPRTMHLHATDPDLEGGEWLVGITEAGVTLEHAHAKGDVAVRAPASDLLLLLWNRVDAGRAEVFGDADLLAAWREQVTL